MHSIISRLVASVPSGSHLVVTDGAATGDEGYREAAKLHRYRLRTVDEFRACFEGLEILPHCVRLAACSPLPNA